MHLTQTLNGKIIEYSSKLKMESTYSDIFTNGCLTTNVRGVNQPVKSQTHSSKILAPLPRHTLGTKCSLEYGP